MALCNGLYIPSACARSTSSELLDGARHSFAAVYKVKLKTNLYSAIKSGDSEALDGGTSQRGSQSRCGEIKMF